ncbi:DNA-binding response regulator [Leucobacter sp. Psy1]|uniref:response regulator n=1 Tax=Leucobacter sp. Psy1 TaxID=2875729 RepID=UPI001CD80DD2|nr:response regulator transcription factor [Leucobacter sp. Psy1]UBH06848.1 DNA-binding response regulator [Leucobacter sp. Psy1]
MIRLLIADDHPIVRAGIVGLFAAEHDFDVVAEAPSGEEAIALAAAHRPEVVLMDLRMPGVGGVAATREIVAASAVRVLVFTTYEDDDQILAAIEAGASGYLLKAAPAAELLAGVRAVAAGQTVLAPSIAAQLVARAQGGKPRPHVDPAPRLTARETEILSLVADGHSNPGIAAHLMIGESTVKTHLLHVFEKLEVNDRTRAVTRALELGILPRQF